MQVQDLEVFINEFNLKLPIELPKEAFIQYGNQQRLANFSLMIGILPPEIKQYVDRDATITNVSSKTFGVALKNGDRILVHLDGTSVSKVEGKLKKQSRQIPRPAAIKVDE